MDKTKEAPPQSFSTATPSARLPLKIPPLFWRASQWANNFVKFRFRSTWCLSCFFSPPNSSWERLFRNIHGWAPASFKARRCPGYCIDFRGTQAIVILVLPRTAAGNWVKQLFDTLWPGFSPSEGLGWMLCLGVCRNFRKILSRFGRLPRSLLPLCSNLIHCGTAKKAYHSVWYAVTYFDVEYCVIIFRTFFFFFFKVKINIIFGAFIHYTL